MSLLRDIQAAAIDGNTDLSTILRKCKVLAARLGHEPFKIWVEQELNGYPAETPLPSYRVFRDMQSYGDFAGPFGSALRNAPLPLLCLPEEMREDFETKEVRDRIAACSEWTKGSGNLIAPWPPDGVALLAQKFYENMNLLSARMVIPRAHIVGLLDAVRNRILSFVLELEKLNPDAGEALPGEQPIRLEQVAPIFNTYIYGGSSNVAVGSHDFSQSVAGHQVEPGDLDALREALKTLGVEQRDAQRLEVLLSEETVNSESPKQPGSKIKEWIADMVAKAADGAWKTAVPEATKLLVKAVYGYIGGG